MESNITSDAIFSLVISNLVKVFPPFMESSDKIKNYKSQMEVTFKALKYIEERYKEKITLNKMADILGYNSSYVSHFFKVNIGINFHDYLTRIRIREATLDLVKTDQSISKRVFVYDNNEDASYKIKEYRSLFKDNPLFMDKMDLKEQDLFQEEQRLVKYKNRIKELERDIEELNKKIELIRSILQ